MTTPRLNKLCAKFAEFKIDALLVTKDVNVQYLSQFTGDSTWLLIKPDNHCLITDFRYIEQAEKETCNFKIIRQNKGLIKKVKELTSRLKIKRLGFDASFISYQGFQAINKELKNQTRLVPTSNLIENLRAIKTPEEISLIRKTITCAGYGFERIKSFIQPGMTEKEVADQMDYFMRQASDGFGSFWMIVAADEHAAQPHARVSLKKINHKSSILIDWGAICKFYCSDTTRMLFLSGISDKWKRIYDIVLEAQRRAIEIIKPGVRIGDVDKAARNYIKQHGYGPNFGHSLGHGTGREVHEAPGVHSKNKARLEPGMVFTVEPAIYLAGQGGVRIEDMALVTEHGCEVLTSEISKDYILKK